MKKESKNTKRALAASVGCVALCTAMLVGTTYAWFTDTASTSVNKIQAGKLDVELVAADESSTLDGGLKFTDYNNKSENILWEPGASYKTQGFRVKNNGNLALKYKLEIDKDGVATDTDSKSLLDAIDFSVIYIDESSTDPNKEVQVTLSEFEGKLGTTDADNTSKVYYIKGTMKTSAGNEYQNLSLEGITLNVLATQDTVEYDSYNNTYDERATYPVTSSSQLATALTSAKDGDVVVLEDNVTIDTSDYNVNNRLNVTANNVTIDLNGKTFTAPNCALTLTGSNITVKNGTMVATPNPDVTTGYGSYVLQVKGKGASATIDGVTAMGGINVSGANTNDADNPDAVVTVKNCTITATNFYTVNSQRNALVTVTDSVLNHGNNQCFWIEKQGYKNDDAAAVNSKLLYQTSTVKINGDGKLYNEVGVAPTAF